MTVLSMPAASPLASMSLTELVEASREFTLDQNLAAVDRIDAVFAMVCAVTARTEAEDIRRDDEDAAAGRPQRPGYARLAPTRLARSHVSTAMGLPTWHADRMITAAVQLHTRLPLLSQHARDGVFDEALLVDLACRLAGVPDPLVGDVERQVVAGLRTQIDDGDPPTRSSLGGRIDRALESCDPDEVDRRHDAARDKRRVTFRPQGEGLTSMWALLPDQDAATLEARLRDTAATDAEVDPGDERTTAQRLADALTDLGTRSPAGPGTAGDCDDGDCHDGDGDCGDAAASGDHSPSGDGPARPARGARSGRLQVTVIAAAAQGLPQRVEFVQGAYASFDRLCNLVLAEENGATRFDLIDPAIGAQDDSLDALKYFISDALKRRIRQRDGTCRHPGCTVRAEDCEIDHVLAFNHADPAEGGPSAEWNLVCLCKMHHQEKTFGPWSYLPGPRGDGELLIRTDTGHEYRTQPGGMLALAREQLREATLRRLAERPHRRHYPPHDTAG